MRIAIDCRPIVSPEKGVMTGIGRYTHALVRHLLRIDEENRYVLFFDERASRGLIGEILGEHHNAEAKVLPFSRFKKFFPYAYSHRFVAAAIAKCGADVYHGTTGSLPMGYRGRSVVTVHDLAIYLHPEWFPGGQFFSRRFVVPASVRRSARVIAVSQSTKTDVQKIFATPAEKIAVVYEGVEPPPPDSWEASSARKKPYVLYLGTIEPRKNVIGLVQAYASLAKRFPRLIGDTELVLAGARGWKSEPVFKAIEEANRTFGNSGPRVQVLGYVSEAEKPALMAHATTFVFPSFYEGFGLPVLEAMNLGVPVITSSLSSLPEIAGRGAALLVDPANPAELSLALKHLLEDPAKRAELGRRGMERSTDFRWDKTAGETLEVYEDAFKLNR